MIDKIQRLKDKFPWPTEKPNMPFNDGGWFPDCNKELLQRYIGSKMVIVELGSWLGLSTRWLLEHSDPNAVVIAIDHWQGGMAELGSDQKDLIPILYDSFLSNCWHHRNRLIPMKTSTIDGMCMLYDMQIKPDLIYVDAGHDYESARADIELAARLFKCTMVGDDFNPNAWPGVVRAVWEVGVGTGDIIVHNNAWTITPRT